MRISFAPYILKFKRPAGTSRGIYTTKPTYFIKVYDETSSDKYGIGEAAVFPGLSPEAEWGFENKLHEICQLIENGEKPDISDYSSIKYGLEQAFENLIHGGDNEYFSSNFISGKQAIKINGLIWMDSFEEMASQIEDKISQGYSCIKLKIGAIDWASESELISNLRNRFSANDIEIRVDANGAFTERDVWEKLDFLAKEKIHSIEQPIKSGNYELMRKLCNLSPIPIALDEELIGIHQYLKKEEILEYIKPHYIILKPALCGGFSGAKEWIDLATKNDSGWWITSCLESNIGLNALAQWTANLNNKMPQGLGTGSLYSNNVDSPIFLDGEELKFNPTKNIDREFLNNLDWRC